MQKIILLFLLSYVGVLEAVWSQSKEKTRIDSLEASLLTTQDDDQKINAILDLARLWLDFDIEKSRKYGMRGLELSKKLRSKKAEIISLNRIAWYYRKRGSYATSVEYATESLSLAEKEKDLDFIGESYFLLGVVYANGLKKYTEAQRYFLKALSFYQQLARKKDIAGVYNSLARLVASEKKKFAKALKYADISIRMSYELESELFIGWCLGAKGEVFYHQQQLDSALKYLEQSNLLAQKTFNNMNFAYNSYFLGDIYLQKGELAKATLILDSTLKLTQKLNAQEILKNAYQGIAKCYAAQQNYQLAFHYQNLHTQLKDSLLNLEISENITLTQAKFDKQQQETRIKILEKETQLSLQKIRAYFNTFGVILFFLSLFLILISYYFRQRGRANKILQEKNEEIALQSEELQLTNEELATQRDMLDETIKQRTTQLTFQNEKLKEYAFNNAHKVRGPLARILGLFVLIKIEEFQIDATLLDYLIKIEFSAIELDKMVREMNQILEAANFFEEGDEETP